MIITNALMVGAFDDQENWHRAAALGVANYGQMTAGGWMYIGPQGIVHGTYNTILNAGRMELGIAADQDLSGVLFVSSGLGGMSGAQGKAVEIANGVGHHRRGGPFPHRHAAPPGLGQARWWRIRPRPFARPGNTRPRARPQAIALCGQHRGPAGPMQPKTRCPFTCFPIRPRATWFTTGDTAPQGLTFCGAHRNAAKRPGPSFRKRVDRSLKQHYPPHQNPGGPGGLLFRLRQQLPEGHQRHRRAGDLQKRPRRPGRVHLSLLRGGHHGTPAVRLRLRPFSLGVPERQTRGSGKDGPGRHGLHRSPAQVPGPGQLHVDPGRRGSQAGGGHPGAYSSTRTPRGAPRSPCASTAWCATAKSAR